MLRNCDPSGKPGIMSRAVSNSGIAALRCLLDDDFAVILLDVVLGATLSQVTQALAG